jgi:shikimate dehydrogenase
MSERRRYVVVGCTQRALVWYAVVRAAFKALELQHVVNVATEESEEWFEQLIGRLRRGDVHGVRIAGHHGVRALHASGMPDASAQRAEVADTLTRGLNGMVVGHCADMLGLADLFEERGIKPGTVVMLGAGTQAMAAAAACEQAGANVIGVTTRSWTSTEKLLEAETAERFRSRGLLTTLWPSHLQGAPRSSRLSEVMRLQVGDLAASANLIIQATPIGTRDGSASDEIVNAIPWEKLRSKTIVCDLALRAGPTAVLNAAAQRGLRTVGGLEAVVAQAVRTLEVWTGLRPPLAPLQIAAERASVELSR